jgi:hypothetical protein
MKSFRSAKTEPRSSGLHVKTLPQKDTLAKNRVPGISVPSSSKNASSFASTQRSWIGQKGEISGPAKLSSVPEATHQILEVGQQKLGLVDGEDLLGRRIALETVPVD